MLYINDKLMQPFCEYINVYVFPSCSFDSGTEMVVPHAALS